MIIKSSRPCYKWGGAMSDKEIKDLVKDMKKYAKKEETPQEALQFLVKAGICKKDGKLSTIYQG